MAKQSLDHPDSVRLVAFGRGFLDHDEMAEVESHLAACEACCQALCTLPDSSETPERELPMPKEGDADAVAGPSALTEAQGSQPGLRPFVKAQNAPRGARRRLAALVSLFVGSVASTQTQHVRRHWRLRITVMGLLGLVALVAVALWYYRTHMMPRQERPAILAAFKKVSPVADGVLGKEEYGPPVMISWSEDNTLAAFNSTLLDPATQNFVAAPTKSKPPTDLSVEMRAAYTDTSLFLAFRVHDQFVDAQESDRLMPMYNDGVEVFIDGDGVFNDFGIGGATGTGSKEGFQLLVNAAGHQFTASRDFTSADWKAAVKRTDDGYIVEIEIPLALIDTKDGPAFVPPGPGAMLNLGLAVTDNDAEVSRQMSYAYLRTPNQTMSPYDGQEAAWKFGIKLEPKWSLIPW